MEISRGVQPAFKTTIKGLAKVNLLNNSYMAREEIHQLIALSALKDNSRFHDFRMLVFADAIKFQPNIDGSAFPEVPFASIQQMVVLPNFPDVCFILFQRRFRGMYIIIRVRKVNHLSRLAQLVTMWKRDNTVEEDSAIDEPLPQRKPKRRLSRRKLKLGPEPPVIVQRVKEPEGVVSPRYLQTGRRERAPAQQQTEATQTTPAPVIQRPESPLEVTMGCQVRNIYEDAIETQRGRSMHEPRQPLRQIHSQPTENVELVFSNKRSMSEGRPLERTRRRARREPEPDLVIDSSGYRMIVPTGDQRKGRPQRRQPQRTARVVVAKSRSSSSTSTSTTTTGIFSDFYSGEVRTIYPTGADPSKAPPAPRRNGKLVQILRTPLRFRRRGGRVNN